MLYPKVLFHFLALYIIFISAGFIQDKLFDGITLHLDRFDGQCRGRNVPQQTFFQGVKTISTKVLINNCTFIAKEGGFKKLLVIKKNNPYTRATIKIERCRSKENLDTCEQYFKQQNIDYCTAIDPNNFISRQNPLFVPFKPPVKCPIDKGVYQAYNVTMDLTSFLFFKVEGWYWKCKYELYSEQNKLVFCMLIDGYFTNSKSKIN